MDKTVFDRFPFYTGMSEDAKTLLRDSVISRDIPEGQIMLGDNNRCIGIPLVMKGRLRMFRTSEKGREMTIYRIGEGELCLLASICTMGDMEYDFSIEAEKDSVIVNIPPDVFKELLYHSDSFRTYVFNALAKRLITSIETIEMLIFNSIEERVMAYLQHHSNAQGIVKTTHEKMAVELGSSREVITRQLKAMSERGLIEIKRGQVIVKIRCD